jgi:phosphoglycolate phosphatase
MMGIRGILFDKDGTLIDMNGTWVPVYREMLAELMTTEPAQIDAIMAKAGYDPATGLVRSGSILAGGTTRELVDVWWPGLSKDEADAQMRVVDYDYRHLAIKHLKPLMVLEPVLEELRGQGLRLGVATNDTEHSARSHMTQLGVAELFDIIIGADSVTRPKPAGDMIHAFAEATQLKPREIAMVGDNPHDIETARAGGAGLAIGVLTGNAAHDDIAHLADHTIQSIAELPALLRRLS